MADSQGSSDTMILECDPTCLARLVKVHQLRQDILLPPQAMGGPISLKAFQQQLDTDPHAGALLSDFIRPDAPNYFSLVFYQDLIQLFQHKEGKKIMTEYSKRSKLVTQNGRERPSDFTPKFLRKVQSLLGDPSELAYYPIGEAVSAASSPETELSELEQKQQELARDYCHTIINWVKDQKVDYAMLSDLKQSDEINFDNMTVRHTEIEWTYARDEKMAIFTFDAESGEVSQGDEILEKPFIVTFQEQLQQLLDRTSDQSATLYLAKQGEGDGG